MTRRNLFTALAGILVVPFVPVKPVVAVDDDAIAKYLAEYQRQLDAWSERVKDRISKMSFDEVMALRSDKQEAKA